MTLGNGSLRNQRKHTSSVLTKPSELDTEYIGEDEKGSGEIKPLGTQSPPPMRSAYVERIRTILTFSRVYGAYVVILYIE